MTQANMSPEVLLAGIEDPRALYDQVINTIAAEGVEAGREELNLNMVNASEANGTALVVPAVEQSVREKESVSLAPYRPGRFKRFVGAITPERMKGKGRTAVAFLAAGILAAGASTVVSGCGEDSANAGSGDTAGQTTDKDRTSTTAEQNADLSWKKKELTPNAEKRWLKDGFADVKKAKTKKEAREAVGKWVDVIKGDPETFKFVYDQLTEAEKDEKIDKTKLFNGEDSTDYAESKLEELQKVLLMSSMRKGSAKKDIRNPHNTGMIPNGSVVVDSRPGVSGDTEAVIIETPNGVRMAIMRRCAQPVVEGKPSGVPTGPTDQPEFIVTTTPRRTPGEEQGCPPGYMTYLNRCVHPRADGPPRGVSQRPYRRGATPGYPGRGNAEKVVGRQESEKPQGVDPTPYGTPGKLPTPQQQIQSQPNRPNPQHNPAATSPGTSQGVTAPEQTNGSNQTSGPGSDPGGF